MAVYLLRPQRQGEASALLKYLHTVRDLADRHGSWQTYDESFRSLRKSQGWGWETIPWELWMKAAQPMPRGSAASGGQSFRAPGKTQVCFKWNAGSQCAGANCRWAHLCKWCGGTHPGHKCFKHQEKPATASGKTPNPSKLQSASPHPGPNKANNHLPTPIDPDALARFLAGYDPNISSYIVDGFNKGFRIGCIEIPAARRASF